MPSRDQSEFLNLPFQAKLEFLYGLPARQKRDLILSAPEAERLVQSFSPETLFYTLKEIVALLLRGYIKVHRLDVPSLSADPPSNRYVQFDEHYLIEFIRNDDITSAIGDFLEEAFEREYKYFAGLLEEVYWGVEAELEEQAYQFRRARLSDRGFPDYFEPQDVFAYLNPRDFMPILDRYDKPSPPDLP